jgi:hypothetical protein
MIKFSRTTNESIENKIHPITGFKISSRHEQLKSNSAKITVSKREYKEREKKRLRQRYLNTIEQSIK